VCWYRSAVIRVVEWPSRAEAIFNGTPSAIIAVAWPCRRPCRGATAGGSPAARAMVEAARVIAEGAHGSPPVRQKMRSRSAR
jgi:hypothetical protein